MKMRNILVTAGLLFGVAWGSVQAETAADAVSVSEAYARAVPPGQPNSASFMLLKNASNADHALVGAQSDAAETVESKIQQRFEIIGLAKIASLGFDTHAVLAGKLFGDRIELVLIAPRDHYIDSLGGQSFRNAPAHARARTHDQCAFALNS